ncbi:MAG TPA: methylenetetrahydrofolate reductase, partial [Candidatus Omnitrophota bacterium]|nr:methylenetetrahydrofolate reductase [Candidatus Omnitrophota bacterium]
DYIDRLRAIGVAARILPGIIPIANYKTILQFAQRDKITIPQEVKKIFEPIQNDLEATAQAGVQFAIRQCRELLAGGAPGIHFYALNKSEAVTDILNAVR